jgi:acetyltransferase
MLETATVLSRNPVTVPPTRCAMVTLSGGEAALIADLGEELGMSFHKLSDATLARLRPAFPAYSKISNPVDAWGLGFNAERFGIVLDALLADPDLDLIGFSIDAPGRGGGDVPYACVMAEACVAAKTDKRLVFFNNTSGSGVNAEVKAVLDKANIAYLSGLRPSLAAIRNLMTLPRVESARPSVVPDAAVALPESEPERFRYLRQQGIPMVAAEAVGGIDDAVAVAEKLGYPVVLKGVAPHLPHKSDLGLVRLALRNRQEVTKAFVELSEILAQHARADAPHEIVVQKMADSGVELIVGIRNQPGFGSFVIAGPGGVLVEIANQASVRLGPVNEAQAKEMLQKTSAGKLLAGVRGNPPCDIDAAASAIAAFSRFGTAQAGTLAALEINPLIVGPNGAAGVDVLFEFHAAKTSEE